MRQKKWAPGIKNEPVAAPGVKNEPMVLQNKAETFESDVKLYDPKSAPQLPPS